MFTRFVKIEIKIYYLITLVILYQKFQIQIKQLRYDINHKLLVLILISDVSILVIFDQHLSHGS